MGGRPHLLAAHWHAMLLSPALTLPNPTFPSRTKTTLAGMVDCGPILPAFPGQRPAEAALVITNPTDRPLEVVGLDLDARHREDEEALRGLDM